MDTAQGKAARLALVWRMGGGQGRGKRRKPGWRLCKKVAEQMVSTTALLDEGTPQGSHGQLWFLPIVSAPSAPPPLLTRPGLDVGEEPQEQR